MMVGKLQTWTNIQKYTKFEWMRCIYSKNFIGQEMNEEYAAVSMWELQNWLKDMGIS